MKGSLTFSAKTSFGSAGANKMSKQYWQPQCLFQSCTALACCLKTTAKSTSAKSSIIWWPLVQVRETFSGPRILILYVCTCLVPKDHLHNTQNCQSAGSKAMKADFLMALTWEWTFYTIVFPQRFWHKPCTSSRINCGRNYGLTRRGAVVLHLPLPYTFYWL